MILRLVKHGKKYAIILSDQILEAAGLSKSSRIQLTINPSGGFLLQAVEISDDDRARSAFKKVKRKHSRLFQRLAEQ